MPTEHPRRPPRPGSTDPDDLPAANQPDALEHSLKPTRITGTRVSELPDPTWLITQGRVLPCTQQTAIDSSLPGAVTAITSEPIRGEAGDVVLIPKGARVFGTVQHSLMNGLDRLAVLWQSISWQLPDNARAAAPVSHRDELAGVKRSRRDRPRW